MSPGKWQPFCLGLNMLTKPIWPGCYLKHNKFETTVWSKLLILHIDIDSLGFHARKIDKSYLKSNQFLKAVTSNILSSTGQVSKLFPFSPQSLYSEISHYKYRIQLSMLAIQIRTILANISSTVMMEKIGQHCSFSCSNVPNTGATEATVLTKKNYHYLSKVTFFFSNDGNSASVILVLLLSGYLPKNLCHERKCGLVIIMERKYNHYYFTLWSIHRYIFILRLQNISEMQLTLRQILSSIKHHISDQNIYFQPACDTKISTNTLT